MNTCSRCHRDFDGPPALQCPDCRAGRREDSDPAPARADRYRSDWERQYAARLDALQAAGEIETWWYESLNFRLADGAWHHPDFLVLTHGCLEVHEVKGYRRDAGMLRFKTGREIYGNVARWRMFEKRDGRWREVDV